MNKINDFNWINCYNWDNQCQISCVLKRVLGEECKFAVCER